MVKHQFEGKKAVPGETKRPKRLLRQRSYHSHLKIVKKLKRDNMNDNAESPSVSTAGSCMNNPDNIDESTAKIQNDEINKLDHDSLAKVFMYLPLLERLEMGKVCQKWREVIEMSWYNVKKINLNSLMIPLNKREDILNIIMTKCRQYLTYLTMQYEYPSVCEVVKTCHNIIHFDIDTIHYNHTVPHEDILQIIMSMPKLKYLKIRMYNSSTSHMYNQILEVLPENMDEVHILTSRSDLEVVPVLPDKFNSLRSLSLHGFSLTGAFMESLLLNKNTLVNLDLAFCQFPFGISSTFSNLHNLEYLNLYEVKNLNNNEVITRIARNCPKLRHLKYLNRDGNGHPAIHELKYLKNLEHLNFPKFNGGNFISEIADSCKKIKYLNVEQAQNLTTSDIKEITKLNNLEYLGLGCWVNSQALIDIASNCLELKELSMPFKDTPGNVLKELRNLKKLETLRFTSCRNLTGNILTKIVSGCTNLKKLHVNNCSNITKASLLQIGKLQYLEELRLPDNIPTVPNGMFDDFRKLKHLSFQFCTSVTDEGIMKVLDNCKKLSHLSIIGTGITVKTPIHASKRKFVYVHLTMWVDESVKTLYYRENTFKSSYLRVL